MANLEKGVLREGENLIDKWAINCLPDGGGKYLGNLWVTNQRLLFEASYDATLDGLLDSFAGGSGVAEGVLILEKKDIQSAKKEGSFFKKKVVINMKDGKTHTFDYGMLSVDKLLEAVMQR